MTTKLYIGEKQKPFYLDSHNYLKKGKLSTKTVKNGTILPAAKDENGAAIWAAGGVIDEKGDFVEESKNDYLFGGKYDYDTTRVKYIDEEVVFFGPFVKHWGHFICDQINRLWYVKNNPTKYKIAYCGWNWGDEQSDIDNNFLKLIELLGCKKSQLINIKQPTKFKKIIIPERAFIGGQFYSKEFEEMIDIIVKNSLKENDSSPERVYFSRTKFAAEKERGEEKIEKQFRKNGYSVVYPEQLSLTEQIAYFNKAKKVAMVSGSISHNLMFTRTNTVDAAIINKLILENKYQFVIDHLTKANISYVDCFVNLRSVCFGLGPFLLTTTKYLKQYFKDNNLKIAKAHRITLSDLIWYYRTYHKIYSNPNNKDSLKRQSKALKVERANR